MNYKLRPMERRRDMPQVLRIERASFPDPWVERDFSKCLSDNNQALVCEDESGQVSGYLIYRFEKDCYSFINLAVDPLMRNKGIGKFMVQSIIAKMEEHKRDSIEATISDKNLDAHLFFRRLGFKARRVLRKFFGESDGYDFVYHSSGQPFNVTKREDQLCRGR